MKVKELLTQMGLENPEGEVAPVADGTGKFKLAVRPPENPLGDPMPSREEAVKILGAHVHRIEKIRAAIASFYGLPVRFKLHFSENSEYVELRIKSPTGKTMATITIGLWSFLQKDGTRWKEVQINHANSRSDCHKRFGDVSPDLAGYQCNPQKMPEGVELSKVIEKLLEAPKWLEQEQEL